MNTNPELSPEQMRLFANGVIACLTPIVVWLVKAVAPKVPSRYLPLMTPVIGVIFGVILSRFGIQDIGWIEAAVSGALGVAVRESVNQNVTKPNEQMQELLAYKQQQSGAPQPGRHD